MLVYKGTAALLKGMSSPEVCCHAGVISYGWQEVVLSMVHVS